MYLRKSRADAELEARGEGETLARHRAALEELALRLGLNVAKTYSEVVSGETVAARPVMRRLLAEVERGLWNGVLVMEVERLARGDTADQGMIAKAFKYSGTKIITPIKTYDPNDEYDEEFFEFSLFMSRREYTQINRRLQRGRLASVREGKYVAHRPPYGYTRKKLEHEKGWTLEPEPEQAEVVRMIFSLYVGGGAAPGTTLIARRLNRLRVPAGGGGQWTAGAVRDILINPVYIGKIRWNRKPVVKKIADGKLTVSRRIAPSEDWLVTPGLHDPIVSEGVFARAGERLSRGRPPVTQRHALQNPLAGLIVCGLCGRRMTRRPYRGAYPDTLLCAAPECPTVSASLGAVEARVVEALEGWLGGYRLTWGRETGTNPNALPNLEKKAAERITTELKALSLQKGKLHDLLEQGVYDAKTFRERARALHERAMRCEADLAALGAEPEHAPRESRAVIPKPESLFDLYRMLPDAAAKNELLRELVEKIVYTKEKGGRWHASPDGFQLTLYPRLPELPHE